MQDQTSQKSTSYGRTIGGLLVFVVLFTLRIEYLIPVNAVFLRRFTRRSAALLAVWSGQSEREPSLSDFELHASCLWVCMDSLTFIWILFGVCRQPFLKGGVVCTNMDQRILLVKGDFRYFLTFC